MIRKLYLILFLAVFAFAYISLLATCAEAQGSALKYSRIYGEYRYCYYFSGTTIVVRRYESCPRYAP